jgi:hypothetical protein
MSYHEQRRICSPHSGKGQRIMSDAFEAWRGFWNTAAGISATLLGLLFVAAALNLKQMVSSSQPQLRALASRAMTAYATVALLGLLVQMPMFPLRRLGALIAFLGLVLVLGLTWKIAKGPNAFSWTNLAPWVGYLIVLFAGAKIALGAIRSIDFLGIAALVLLIAATAISFDWLGRLPS